MNDRQRRIRARRAALAACGHAIAVVATPLGAQEPTAEQTEPIRIDVTGSNIKRTESEGALPLSVITREEIDHAGIQTAQELLDRISANQSFGGSNPALGIGNFVTGFTAASLRGLGSERTLVLLNGHRLAPYALSGGNAVDLSGVPLAAIERVEILKDGASAIYGTDAIAGVINFVLRKDFKGVEINGDYDVTEHPGGNSGRGNATLGFGDLARDRYNIFVSADYLKQDSLKALQRDFSRTGYLPSIGVDGTNPGAVPADFLLFNPLTGEVRGFNPSIPPSGPNAGS
ncbi:MAG TPA: TonB-dependent receptor plug domain-containing protein, partial [Casimicrobiaceae bacterium]|nr:TonB-dependent receptor plug domain-containing protein [Casimicrobiaceae bacterium]